MKRFVRNQISRPSLQPLWERLLKLCHAGMNTGGGQSFGESGEINALRLAVQRAAKGNPITVFDIGANDGSYIKMAHAVIGDSLRAFAFEPQKAIFRTLEREFEACKWLTLSNLALGEREDTAVLHSNCDGDVRASFIQESATAAQRNEPVAVSTIDRVCKDFGISHIDFLKVDTEGYEFEVLLGAKEMMNRGSISSIQFEFGSDYTNTAHHLSDFWEMLSPKYDIYRILRRGVRKLHSYSFDLEIYKTTNYLCILR